VLLGGQVLLLLSLVGQRHHLVRIVVGALPSRQAAEVRRPVAAATAHAKLVVEPARVRHALGVLLDVVVLALGVFVALVIVVERLERGKIVV
jgi:hypothetical protein